MNKKWYQQDQRKDKSYSYSHQCRLCQRYFNFLPAANRHVVIFHKIDADHLEEYVIENQTQKKRNPVIIQLIKSSQFRAFQPDLNGNEKSDKYVLKRRQAKTKDKNLRISKSHLYKSNQFNSRAKEGKKEHTCHICNKSFPNLCTLKVHINAVHEGQKNYQCTICDKFFGYAWYVNNHIKIVHKAIKDHKCKFCNRSFGSTSNLKHHVCKAIQKSRSKDYKCSICGLSYFDKSSMKRHIKIIHEGKNNNRCKFCDRNFCDSRYLKQHIKIIHEGKKITNA